MFSEPAVTAAASSSWTALFAALWFARKPSITAARPSESGSSRRARTGGWSRVDLFTPALPKTGSRFDDTVAWPVDLPRRLEATIDTARRRLRAMPDPRDLGRRSLHYRAQLQRTLRDARHALARLDEGTYGTCTDCASPISLAALAETPWASVCAWCAADLSPASPARAPRTDYPAPEVNPT